MGIKRSRRYSGEGDIGKNDSAETAMAKHIDGWAEAHKSKPNIRTKAKGNIGKWNQFIEKWDGEERRFSDAFIEGMMKPKRKDDVF